MGNKIERGLRDDNISKVSHAVTQLKGKMNKSSDKTIPWERLMLALVESALPKAIAEVTDASRPRKAKDKAGQQAIHKRITASRLFLSQTCDILRSLSLLPSSVRNKEAMQRVVLHVLISTLLEAILKDSHPQVMVATALTDTLQHIPLPDDELWAHFRRAAVVYCTNLIECRVGELPTADVQGGVWSPVYPEQSEETGSTRGSLSRGGLATVEAGIMMRLPGRSPSPDISTAEPDDLASLVGSSSRVAAETFAKALLITGNTNVDYCQIVALWLEYDTRPDTRTVLLREIVQFLESPEASWYFRRELCAHIANLVLDLVTTTMRMENEVCYGALECVQMMAGKTSCQQLIQTINLAYACPTDCWVEKTLSINCLRVHLQESDAPEPQQWEPLLRILRKILHTVEPHTFCVSAAQKAKQQGFVANKLGTPQRTPPPTPDGGTPGQQSTGSSIPLSGEQPSPLHCTTGHLEEESHLMTISHYCLQSLSLLLDHITHYGNQPVQEDASFKRQSLSKQWSISGSSATVIAEKALQDSSSSTTTTTTTTGGSSSTHPIGIAAGPTSPNSNSYITGSPSQATLPVFTLTIDTEECICGLIRLIGSCIVLYCTELEQEVLNCVMKVLILCRHKKDFSSFWTAVVTAFSRLLSVSWVVNQMLELEMSGHSFPTSPTDPGTPAGNHMMSPVAKTQAPARPLQSRPLILLEKGVMYGTRHVNRTIPVTDPSGTTSELDCLEKLEEATANIVEVLTGNVDTLDFFTYHSPLAPRQQQQQVGGGGGSPQQQTLLNTKCVSWSTTLPEWLKNLSRGDRQMLKPLIYDIGVPICYAISVAVDRVASTLGLFIGEMENISEVSMCLSQLKSAFENCDGLTEGALAPDHPVVLRIVMEIFALASMGMANQKRDKRIQTYKVQCDKLKDQVVTLQQHCKGYEYQIRTLQSKQTTYQRALALLHCCICFEALITQESVPCCLPCGHVFHDKCINTALTFKNECPLCRRSLSAGEGVVQLKGLQE